MGNYKPNTKRYYYQRKGMKTFLLLKQKKFMNLRNKLYSFTRTKEEPNNNTADQIKIH